MKIKDAILFPVILCLFDGGGDGGGGDAAGGSQAEAPVYTPSRSRSGGDLANVQYGLQDGADAALKAVTENDRTEQWKSTRQQFKAEFDADVQRIIDKRFAQAKSDREQLDAVSPVIDLLLERYGVEGGNIDALLAAIDEDDGYWQDAADEAGMTVEQYKQMKKWEKENAEMRAQLKAQRDAEAQNQTLQRWFQEAEALKQVYPNFDINFEADNNPEFLSLLEKGVPMQHAFELCHLDEIKQGVAASTARAAQRQITANIRARGSRPAEAGANPGAPFTVKSDVTKLSKKDRAEIAKRVLGGERIVF